MKKFLKTILFGLFVSLLFMQCQNKTEGQKQKADPIEIDTTYNFVKDTVFLENKEIVYLGTQPDAHIQEVSELFVDSTHIFVYDKFESKIFRFDRQGQYQDQLQIEAENEEPYQRLLDFYVDKEYQEIHVLTDAPYQIRSYDYNFNPIDSINTKRPYFELVKKGSNFVARGGIKEKNGPDNFSIDVFDAQTGVVIDSLHPFKNREHLEPPIFGKDLLTATPSVLFALDGNTVYEYGKDGITEKYHFNLPSDIESGDRVSSNIMERMVETEEILLFKNRKGINFYDRHENKIYRYGTSIMSDDPLPAYFSDYLPINGQLGKIALVKDPELLKMGAEAMIKAAKDSGDSTRVNRKYLNFIEPLDAEDNPILFIYDLKK